MTKYLWAFIIGLACLSASHADELRQVNVDNIHFTVPADWQERDLAAAMSKAAMQRLDEGDLQKLQDKVSAYTLYRRYSKYPNTKPEAGHAAVSMNLVVVVKPDASRDFDEFKANLQNSFLDIPPNFIDYKFVLPVTKTEFAGKPALTWAVQYSVMTRVDDAPLAMKKVGMSMLYQGQNYTVSCVGPTNVPMGDTCKRFIASFRIN